MDGIKEKSAHRPAPKHPASVYLTHDLFFGEEGKIECREVKLVTARKEHECFLSTAYGKRQHMIAIGELHRVETALVDGSFWGRYRCCLTCMDRDIEGDF